MHKAKGFFFRKRILESVSFLIFLFKNRLWNPFGNFFFFWKRIVESVSCLWNGLQNSFHTLWNGFRNLFHKKICKFFYETNYGIRFTVLWNGFCNPFPINFDFFGETAFVFRLVKVWNALYSLWNEKQIPFHFTSKQKKTLASTSKQKNTLASQALDKKRNATRAQNSWGCRRLVTQ